VSLRQFILLLLFSLFALPCQAADFRAGQVEGLLDLTLAYGLGVRLDDADPREFSPNALKYYIR